MTLKVFARIFFASIVWIFTACIPVHEVTYTNQCNVAVSPHSDDHPHPALVSLPAGETSKGVRGVQEGVRFFEAHTDSGTIIDSQKIDVQGAVQVTFCE